MPDPQSAAAKFPVQVRFFASLRERMGRAETVVEVVPGATVAQVWAAAAGSAEIPERVLAAVNMEYVDWHHPVKVDDEVAFFPPVTGG